MTFRRAVSRGRHGGQYVGIDPDSGEAFAQFDAYTHQETERHGYHGRIIRAYDKVWRAIRCPTAPVRFIRGEQVADVP